MKCRFCFATFNDVKRVLPKELAFKVPGMLKKADAEKIIFVGGEPMLCPYLGELLIITKKVGLSTKIVSNGTGINESFLKKYGEFIDQVSLSIDSSSNEKEKILGRGWGKHIDKVKEISLLLKKFQIPLQINTTVTKLTWSEDMHELIEQLKPFRWKVFQVLPIRGQNDSSVEELLIDKEMFEFFKETHKDLDFAIFEDNDLMTGSYIMLDPLGRFFDDTTGKHIYSKSIFEIGVREAFKQVKWDIAKFQKRKGVYNWDSLKKDLFEQKRSLFSSSLNNDGIVG